MDARLIPEVAWRRAGLDGGALDARLLPLLRAISRTGTLRAGALAVGMSYRSCWDLLVAQTSLAGGALVVLQRGRGTRLTPMADRLIAADDEVRMRLASMESALAVVVSPNERGAKGRALRIVASHDPLLSAFVQAASTRAKIAVDLQFKGSLDSLAEYCAGRSDLAGFHVLQTYSARLPLNPKRDRLIRFAEREQGLMLAAGNPRGVHALSDLARPRMRFVNRQRGSGTRLLFDELLATAGIERSAIAGYDEEEFTHLAVAVSVAAGRADAGFGVHAAAARFGLAFVPLHRETYWLATRARLVDDPLLLRFRAALRGRPFLRLANGFVGYDVRGAGEVTTVQAIVGRAHG